MTLDLSDPIAVLLAAADALNSAGFEIAAYGGLALAAYGTPRETRDADDAGAVLTALANHIDWAFVDDEIRLLSAEIQGHAVAERYRRVSAPIRPKVGP